MNREEEKKGTKEEHEECEHEFEIIKSGYSYDHYDSGNVYKFEKHKCKKCGKIKNIKYYDL
jgi:hypothetical protein